MFRTTLLLLIATMLVCPLRCSAFEPVVRSDAASGGHRCCDACPSELVIPEAASAPGKRPAPGEGPLPEKVPGQCPAEDCECGNCICNGAVVEGGADLLVASILDFVAILPVPRTGLHRQIAGASGADARGSQRSVQTSGRAARIAHQSLLI